MTNADLMTTEFPVKLPDGTVLAVQKLSLIGERKIGETLARRLAESMGPGSYFANAKPALDWLQSQGMHAAYSQAVSDLTRMVAAKTLPTAEAVDDFRMTPDGLACELFLRTRKTHPDLAEALIRSQLNDLTAWQVCVALWEGLASDRKSGPAPAGDVAG